MSHRPLTLALLLSAVAVCGSSWAADPQKGYVPGYFDTKSGTFVTSAIPASSDADTLAQATYTGTLSLKINITLKTGLPADWTISCAQIASVIDVGGLTYSNTKSFKATRSGSTASCQINMPYSWLLNGAGGSVYTTYTVTTMGDSAGLEQVSATGTIAPITIPANGAVTSRTVNVTL